MLPAVSLTVQRQIMKIHKPYRSSLPKLGKTPRVRVVLPPVPKRFKKPSLQQQTEEALVAAPRITNETVAEHREEVLKGARKYKYPLEQSKQKIVIITTSLLATAAVVFLVYCGLSLYKFQSTSYFMYRVTQIIPFPVAKAGTYWVSYESYLFELRRYIHYYESQQDVNFSSASGKIQLDVQKPIAMQEVVDRAYIKDLARKNGVTVRDSEVRAEIDMLRAQNRLTRGDDELSAIIRKFYGWSIEDLRSEIRDQLLAQKVAARLDTEASAKAQTVLTQLRAGGDFAALAKQYSEDQSTKDNGGLYNDTAITLSSQEVPSKVVQTLQSMKVGDVSDVVSVPGGLEIVKLTAAEGSAYKAAHILIKVKDIQLFIQPIAKDHPAKHFIELPKPQLSPTGPAPGSAPATAPQR